MPSWDTVELGHLIQPDRKISYGIVQPGQPIAHGVPIIRVTDIRGGRINTDQPLRVDPDIEAGYERTRLRGGELLMTIVGTVGETAIASSELAGWNIARAIAIIPVQSDVGPYWVQLALRSPAVRARIDSRQNTTVQATLNLRDVAELPIALPPLAERSRIIAVLGALDDKIELNRRMNGTLEAMARAIFRDWFVDFGPTRAKMAGAAPYLVQELWNLFPDRLNGDDKPDGWPASCLGKLAIARADQVSPTSLDPETPYIGLEHMPRCSVALADWEGAAKVTSGKIKFRAGDFLFGKLRPYFHKAGVAPVDGICSSDIVVVRPARPEAAMFTLMCISDAAFVDYTDRTSTGTKMPRTSWRQMGNYGVVQPHDAVLRAFEATAGPMVDRIRANVLENRTLAQTRDLLLPKLMSGEIRLRDAEQALEDAA